VATHFQDSYKANALLVFVQLAEVLVVVVQAVVQAVVPVEEPPAVQVVPVEALAEEPPAVQVVPVPPLLEMLGALGAELFAVLLYTERSNELSKQVTVYLVGPVHLEHSNS